jgi:hypothetical protein
MEILIMNGNHREKGPELLRYIYARWGFQISLLLQLFTTTAGVYKITKGNVETH